MHWPQKYLPNGTCGVVSPLAVQGGREAAEHLHEGI